MYTHTHIYIYIHTKRKGGGKKQNNTHTHMGGKRDIWLLSFFLSPSLVLSASFFSSLSLLLGQYQLFSSFFFLLNSFVSPVPFPPSLPPSLPPSPDLRHYSLFT
jgi:hypothetical protein